MTTLPNMGLVLPTRGAPGSGVWGDTEDANLGKEDAHDHTTGKGLPIRSAAISIDADVSFGSSWAPTNLQRIQFASVTALTGNNKSLFVNTADNELYWRSNAGSNVKLTAGAALNVAAFTGGFGGDYAAVGAVAAFDDAGDRYTFKQQAPGNWARMASGEVRIFETGTTESVFVGLAAPAALASSFTITLPLAAPTSTPGFMQMSTGGVVSIAAAQVYQHSPMFAVLGDVTATKSIGVAGSTSPRLSLTTSTAEHCLPLVIPVGTLTAYTVRVIKISAAGTISVKLIEGGSSSGSGTSSQLGATQSNSANNPGEISLGQSGLSTAMNAQREYHIVITGGGTTGDIVLAYSASVAPT